MADSMHPWPLRVAFAYGDERLAAHVREAVGGAAELVYAAPVAEFDLARLAGDRVDAVLVNVDAGDVAGVVEARLAGVAIRVVFNDPEISATLEGWARARWLRHLMAKLRGDANVDPPRPGAVLAARAADAASTEVAPDAAAVSPVAIADADADAARAASTPESEVDVALPAADATPPADAEVTLDEVPAPVADEPIPVDAREATSVVDVLAPEATAITEATAPATDDSRPGRDAPLDVDTEALSAMIDARLAASEAEAPVVEDLDAAWASAPAPVDEPAVAAREPAAPEPAVAEAATTVPGGAAPHVVVGGDPADADILASLPSLDEWVLVDPDLEAPVAAHAVGGPSAAPAVPDGLGAGLELVPLDGVAPPHGKDDLVQRWLHESGDGQRADGGKA
jgi:two-component system chemotaxis response regulator CheB/chemosensory pili system protein ChpB (putative protein-glutamate methylesterase)